MFVNKRENQLDRMLNYMKMGGSETVNPDDYLTPHDQEKFNKLLQLIALIRQHKVKAAVIPIYMKACSVSKSQAYYDWSDAEWMMGSMEKVRKEFQRVLIVEKLWEEIEKASIAGKSKEVAMLIRELIIATGVNKIDPEQIDYDKIQPSQPIIGYLPHLLGEEVPPDDVLIGELKKIIGKKKVTLSFDKLGNESAD